MSQESPSIKNNSEKGASKTSIVVVGGLLAVALLAAASWFLISKSRAETAEKPPAAPAVKEVMHLESFVVNLADPPGDCFLRLGVDLGLGHPLKARSEKDAGAVPTAQVRDVVLGVLTTYHSADLLAPSGKVKLKEELVKSLQAAVPELEVREVYFTDFLVQR
jgi:flagellar FliL protein